MRRAIALAITLAGVLASGCREREIEDPHQVNAVDPALLMAPKPQAVEDVTHLYGSAPKGFVDIVHGARSGVVAIRSAKPVKSGPAAMFPGAPETTADVALGTGFLIESGEVYAVTTNKIASAAEGNELHVVLDDTTEVPAKVIGRDADLDIALLQVDRPRLSALPLGESNDLKIGEWLVVLGNPFGEEVTASAGIVSSTGKQAAGSLMQDRGMAYRTFRMFIQTDAHIHRGNSGGPVLDTAGQVIGMAIATGDRPGELAFILPIDRIREALPDLRERGQVTRSWLGAKVKPVTAELGASLGLAAGQGGYITEVIGNSPAFLAELRAGDVILEWNGKKVDQASLPWLVQATPPGKRVPVIIWRNKSQTRVDVTAQRMPR
jgi:serine protease Do